MGGGNDNGRRFNPLFSKISSFNHCSCFCEKNPIISFVFCYASKEFKGINAIL